MTSMLLTMMSMQLSDSFLCSTFQKPLFSRFAKKDFQINTEIYYITHHCSFYINSSSRCMFYTVQNISCVFIIKSCNILFKTLKSKIIGSQPCYQYDFSFVDFEMTKVVLEYKCLYFSYKFILNSPCRSLTRYAFYRDIRCYFAGQRAYFTHNCISKLIIPVFKKKKPREKQFKTSLQVQIYYKLQQIMHSHSLRKNMPSQRF